MGHRVNTNKIHVKVKVAQSCPTLCNPMDSPWNSPGQNIGVGSLSLLQGIFPTQGLNPGLSHCRQILYQLSYEGSPIRFMGNIKFLRKVIGERIIRLDSKRDNSN